MQNKFISEYRSLALLFIPGLLFIVLIWIFRDHPKFIVFEQFPWQFAIIGVCGIVATLGGVLDWRYHRNPLNRKIPAKERKAEAEALGLGGIPMFTLMWFAMLSKHPNYFLIPILIVLIYTVVAISYDEFVFHKKRCGKVENLYHRMLVFGNGLAWLAWIHFIFYA